jgi:hypothetical protein
MFLKFFVVMTCVFFWIRLGYRWLFMHYRGRGRRRYHERLDLK